MNSESYFEYYMEQLSQVEPCTAEEETVLLADLLKGSSQAEGRLIEGNLHRVLKLAEEFGQDQISLADLVQEGNMALTMAVSEFEGGDFGSYLDQNITAAFHHAADSLDMEGKATEELLARINVMNKVAGMLAEELGREATVPELAERMKMTPEEIRGLMQLALDAIQVEGK